MSLSHLQLAQTMREEAKKLEDFRERQKDARKKVSNCVGTAKATYHSDNVQLAPSCSMF